MLPTQSTVRSDTSTMLSLHAGVIMYHDDPSHDQRLPVRRILIPFVLREGGPSNSDTFRTTGGGRSIWNRSYYGREIMIPFLPREGGGQDDTFRLSYYRREAVSQILVPFVLREGGGQSNSDTFRTTGGRWSVKF